MVAEQHPPLRFTLLVSGTFSFINGAVFDNRQMSKLLILGTVFFA